MAGRAGKYSILAAAACQVVSSNSVDVEDGSSTVSSRILALVAVTLPRSHDVTATRNTRVKSIPEFISYVVENNGDLSTKVAIRITALDGRVLHRVPILEIRTKPARTDGSANGTTAMSKHSCPPAETNQVMTATATRRDATTSEKKLITVALADMCAVDMRPFYIVKGTGFRNYTQTVLNIGVNSKVGMLVDNILPDPTTESRNV
ncbi:hypothetical protein AXG93_4530s1290 [Marchantia polymorpha subsp. ruderalis]|uniref:Hermes trasposase DNA-binding domain-containing protein n=1 Tax=Marchantia polymorpha subsp. ruderalis TaxID=1480154 RepID=A0A176VUJ5_MARPO|nr:hypothetical protein AXG93_4530s1290 [Marchantia polymorpha subsp. ruderalis]